MKLEISPSIQKELSAIRRAGFGLVEVILGTALFVLFVTALVGTLLYGQEATAISGNRAQAVFLAEEGLEVVKNLKDESYAGLTSGSHGLAIASGAWGLSGFSDVTGIFTRQISIAIVDTGRKDVTATVSWQQNPQRTGSVSLVTRLTNWAASAGLPTCTNQADKLSVDSSGASLAQGSMLLSDILVENTDATCNIVIDKITVTWTDVTKDITRARVDNASIWSGSATTGALLDVTDTTLSSADGQLDSDYLFSGKMSGNTFTITFTMGDGTTKAVTNITP